MITPVLAVIFLFAVSAQGKTINCYVCTTDPNSNRYPQCKDPIEGSHTETVDSSQRSCFTMFIKNSITGNGPPTYVSYTLRGHSGIDHCLDVDKGAVKSQFGVSTSRTCYECQSDKCNTCTEEDVTKCNSATSIHVSFLTFLGLFGSLYVLRN